MQLRDELESLKGQSPLKELGFFSKVRRSGSLRAAETVMRLLSRQKVSKERSRKANVRQSEASSRLQTLSDEQSELQNRSLNLETESRDLRRRKSDLSSQSSALETASRTLPGA